MFRHDSRSGDRRVADVVGVVLIVAMTVLLAATAVTLFFGFQERPERAHPGTAFEIVLEPTAASDAVTITHASGDAVEAGALAVVIDDASATAGDPNGRYDVAGLSRDLTATSPISVGDGVELAPETLSGVPSGASVDFSEATVRVVWADGDRTTTLQTWYGPSR